MTRDNEDFLNYRASKARMVARECLARMEKFTKQTKSDWRTGNKEIWRTVCTDNDISCGDCDHKRSYTRNPSKEHCMCFNLDTGHPCSHISAKEISNLGWTGWIEYIPAPGGTVSAKPGTPTLTSGAVMDSQCEYEAHIARRASH